MAGGTTVGAVDPHSGISIAKTEADSATADIDVVEPAVRSLDHSMSKGAKAKQSRFLLRS